MFTDAAHRALNARHSDLEAVVTYRQLRADGVTADQTSRQVAAARWQVFGNAVLLHNTEPTRRQAELIALINCGPRAVLTSFTTAERAGLRGWERPEIHVLAPAGTARPQIPGIRLHRVGDWSRAQIVPGRRLHRLAPALVIAASSFARPRPACAILAAAVQQRLLLPSDLAEALHRAPRTRHRRDLILATADIAQGAEALSEIDFARLCRGAGLPEPEWQAIRRTADGKRRYLDAEWRRPDGRPLAVEVDGAIHLAVERWSADQLRQNELVIAGAVVLRFPSVVVRTEPARVIDQLRRALES